MVSESDLAVTFPLQVSEPRGTHLCPSLFRMGMPAQMLIANFSPAMVLVRTELDSSTALITLHEFALSRPLPAYLVIVDMTSATEWYVVIDVSGISIRKIVEESPGLRSIEAESALVLTRLSKFFHYADMVLSITRFLVSAHTLIIPCQGFGREVNSH